MAYCYNLKYVTNDTFHILPIYQPVLWCCITYAVVTKKSGNPSHFSKTPHQRRISKDKDPVLRNSLKPGQGAAMAHLVRRPCHRLVVCFQGDAKLFSFLHSFKAVCGAQRAQYSIDTGRESLSSWLKRPGLEAEYWPSPGTEVESMQLCRHCPSTS